MSFSCTILFCLFRVYFGYIYQVTRVSVEICPFLCVFVVILLPAATVIIIIATEKIDTQENPREVVSNCVFVVRMSFDFDRASFKAQALQ